MIDDTFPVFNTMHEAVRRTQANTSVIFVPARFAADAIMEAADAGIRLIICITEGIPTLDVIKAYRFVELKGAKLIGPNCPGLISPGESLVGILPGQVFTPGNIGVISRSGTLTYEIVSHLTANSPLPLVWEVIRLSDFIFVIFWECYKMIRKLMLL